ncbi:hypothetical protein [Clostridium weizhouense]|uniref:hypothetical protein n=1 Tax=Clostridium weizhouense TaxID=2859781 RepID=UPI0021565F5C|nr:hypothetical protein [Clostridium weizhouense]
MQIYYIRSKGRFSFAGDRYFSFWLCAYKADTEGNSIISWDHDLDDEIEAMENNIIDFLNDMEEEVI